MSLHFLGIRDFPILHRQFSSPTIKLTEIPTSSQDPVPGKDQDLARDSKDVLIQRLNDLSYHLINSAELEDEVVTALHVDVDRMEEASRRSRGVTPESSFKDDRSIGTPRTFDEDTFWGPFSPSRKPTMRFPDSPSQNSLVRPRLHRVQEMYPDKAILLATQAKELTEALEGMMEELKARKEETDVSHFQLSLFVTSLKTNIIQHIHALLITRAEHAAQRIIELESHVKELLVKASH